MASGIGEFLGKTTGNLPNWAWGLVIIGGAGVGFIYVRKQSAATATATPETGNPAVTYSGSTDATLGQQNTFPTVPGPNGQIPVLPTGYIPITAPDGTVVSWEPAPPPTQTIPGNGNGSSSGGSGTLQGNPPVQGTVPGGGGYVNPLIPYTVTWSGNHYFPVQPGHVFNWQGTNYWIVSNTGGVIRGVPNAQNAGQAAGKGQVVLYAPGAYYH